MTWAWFGEDPRLHTIASINAHALGLGLELIQILGPQTSCSETLYQGPRAAGNQPDQPNAVEHRENGSEDEGAFMPHAVPKGSRMRSTVVLYPADSAPA